MILIQFILKLKVSYYHNKFYGNYFIWELHSEFDGLIRFMILKTWNFQSHFVLLKFKLNSKYKLKIIIYLNSNPDPYHRSVIFSLILLLLLKDFLKVLERILITFNLFLLCYWMDFHRWYFLYNSTKQ